ncbi:hypothetical protein F4779DRAFT_390826 [Xylariaceae sp. FL0662B]|nr:hypothetical protein F4779DRAFT_390826 [Xylariaceae sp. FL0662B]
MKNCISLLLLFPYVGNLVLAKEKYAPVAAFPHKRQAKTCEQSWGAGWKQCGGQDSTFCFNPDHGQSCCAKDSGYCDAGKYCAPVAGYCCFEGEDLATCAKNAGFKLPSSESISASTVAPLIAADPTVTSPTLTVTPFLARPSTSTGIDLTDTTVFPNIACNSTAPASTLVSNTTVSPFVQVSSSVKEDRVFAGSMMVTIAGILIAFF